jgi:membrane protease YdiL (CAAX protease family)
VATSIKKHPVAAYYIVALLIGGVFAAPFIASTAGLIPQIPFIVIFVAAWSASLAAVIVSAVIGGWSGVKALLGRFLIWRFSLWYWLATLLLPAVASLGAVLLAGAVSGRPFDASQLQPLYGLIPLLIVKVIQAGVGEEFGWRGFALPRLQTRHSALVATIIVALMHALWHWPLYFVEGMTQHMEMVAWGFVPALLLDTLMIILWSVVYTWLYNNSKGSVLIAAVFHAVVPTWMTYFTVANPWGVGLAIDVLWWYIGFFAVIAVAIVAIYGPKHLSRRAERQTA